MRAACRALVFAGVFAGASPAAAQLGYDPRIIAGDPAPAQSSRLAPAPDFRTPRIDLREAPGPSRNGLIAALPVRENVTLGIGRFQSTAPRPRTHLEAEPQPTEMRRRGRGIAALGVSVRF